MAPAAAHVPAPHVPHAESAAAPLTAEAVPEGQLRHVAAEVALVEVE